MTVSYTHLDVYKRQRHERVCRNARSLRFGGNQAEQIRRLRYIKVPLLHEVRRGVDRAVQVRIVDFCELDKQP